MPAPAATTPATRPPPTASTGKSRFLHLYDYPGLTWKGTPIGTENNILPSIRGQIRGPLYHAREADPARRFKALTYRDGHLYTLVSADCIHWQELDVPPQPSADVSELYLDETLGPVHIHGQAPRSVRPLLLPVDQR